MEFQNDIVIIQLGKVMSNFMSKQFDQKFKENAVAYYLEHKDLGLQKAAENLGVSRTALGVWTKAARENNGSVPTRGNERFFSIVARY